MFKNATSEFKKRMAEQPLIQRPVIAPMASGQDERIYTGSDANPNNNGLQSFTPSKKRKTEGMRKPLLFVWRSLSFLCNDKSEHAL